MGLIRLLFLLAVVAAVAYLLRDVLRGLGGWIDGNKPVEPDRPKRPQLVALERSAWSTLGLEEGASRFEIEAAYRRVMAENDEERVSELSPQLREHAARLREDATKAYNELLEDEGEGGVH